MIYSNGHYRREKKTRQFVLTLNDLQRLKLYVWRTEGRVFERKIDPNSINRQVGHVRQAVDFEYTIKFFDRDYLAKRCKEVGKCLN